MAQKVYGVFSESKSTWNRSLEKLFDTEEKAIKYADYLRKEIGNRFIVLWKEVDVE